MIIIFISFIVYMLINFLVSMAFELILISFFADNQSIGLIYQIGCNLINIHIAFPIFLVINKMNIHKIKALFHTEVKIKISMLFIITLILLLFTVSPIIIISIFNRDMISSYDIISIIWLVFFTPFIEEIIFRGVMLQKLRKYGAVPAILITTVLFMVGHMNIGNMIISFVPGIILCIAAYKSESIKYTVPLHILVNLLSVVIQIMV